MIKKLENAGLSHNLPVGRSCGLEDRRIISLVGRNSFIHSCHLYSASPSLLLLRSAPDIAQILCRSFTPKRHRQFRVKDFAQGPYVANRVRFEPTTLWSKGFDTTDAPPHPT